MPRSDSALADMLRSRARAQRVVRLYPETALRLADALRAVVGMDRALPPKRIAQSEYPFTLERWSKDGKHLEETLALFRNALVARAAFPEAVRQRHRSRIMVRKGTRVLEDSGEG